MSHRPIQYPRVQRKLEQAKKRQEEYNQRRKREDAIRKQIEGHGIRQPSVVGCHSTTPSIRFSGFATQQRVSRTQEPTVSVTRSAPPSPAPVAGPQSNVAAKPTQAGNAVSQEEIAYGQKFAARVELEYAVEAIRDLSISDAQRVVEFIREHRLTHSEFGVEIARHHLRI